MKQRDLEILSCYLDGQLSSSDSARLESRLRTEPDLRSVLQDLRGARGLLRQLPMRKAPRNFSLTPQMVGRNPPLPRSYPIFKFSAALATILLFFSIGLNILGPQLASQPLAFGMGGGGEPLSEESAAVSEAPQADMLATEAPAEESAAAMAPMPTTTGPTDETARAMETAVTKQGETENGVGGVVQSLPPVAAEPARTQSVSSAWQWILTGVALISLLIMIIMRQLAARRWRSKG